MKKIPLFAAREYMKDLLGESSNEYKLQKALYFVQVLFAARNPGQLLLDAEFEAGKFGPVLVKPKFIDERIAEFDESIKAYFEAVAEVITPTKDESLYLLTHRPEGAWQSASDRATESDPRPKLTLVDMKRDFDLVGAQAVRPAS